ncbi:hypothetical protein BH09VER1_BH09VER1_40440 [soil metagenome]
MTAHEILQHIRAETAGEIFLHLYEKDRPAYRATIQLLASRRKLRPVILDRKTRPERYAWIQAELARKSNEDAATEILQTWLLGAHQDLVCAFLDSLEIAHNGHGLLEVLPPQPPEEKLKAALDGLLEKFPTDAVAIYLNLFSEMDIADWPSLKKLINQDPRLCLAPQTAIA